MTANRTTYRLLLACAVAVAVAMPAVANAGQLPAAPPPPLAAEPGALVLRPVEDAYVRADQPDSTHGGSLRYVVDGAPVKQAFVKFDVSGLSQPVTAARLRLHVRNVVGAGSPAGGTVSRADTHWAEKTVTYNNRPGLGAALADIGPVELDRWYEVDVTAAVTGNGLVAFGLSSGHINSASYDSREAGEAVAPHLVISTAGQAAPPPPPSSAAVLVGAGDIASCSSGGDEQTADLLDGIPGTVFTAGDIAYPDGSAANFADCYNPTWGRHKARTRPAPGNHEYLTPGAAGYFGYFGTAAGPPATGYYSYDLGDWHIVVINSNCSKIGGCQAGSAQETWLRADLAASTKTCTAAIWHHPLFTSGANHAPATEMLPIFQALYDAGAEVVITGHNHQYERFAPQDPAGVLDLPRGIRHFVAGTGGASHYGFGPAAPNSEVRNGDTYGVLKLTLRTDGYDFEFVPEAGKTFTDSGSGTCH